MGGVWDRSNRHGHWETAVKEAVIAWNAPSPYHPAAKFFVNHALDHAFGGAGKWQNAFTHHDKHHIERAMGTGVVMDRKKKTPQRMPDSFYDVSIV